MRGIRGKQGTSNFPTQAPGASGGNATVFTFSIAADAPCGTKLPFSLAVTFAGGNSPAEAPEAARLLELTERRFGYRVARAQQAGLPDRRRDLHECQRIDHRRS